MDGNKYEKLDERELMEPVGTPSEKQLNNSNKNCNRHNITVTRRYQ